MTKKPKPAPKSKKASKQGLPGAPALGPRRAELLKLADGTKTMAEIADKMKTTPQNVSLTLGFMKRLHGIEHQLGQDGKVKAALPKA